MISLGKVKVKIMAIDIQANTVNMTLAASQQASALKKEPAVKTNPVVDVPKEGVARTDSSGQTAKPAEISSEKLQEVVNKLQDYVDKYERDLKFSVDDDTGRTVVRLLDNENNVVKQYPTEEVLSLISHLEQNKGLFIDQA